MVTDEQVRILMRHIQAEKSLVVAAAKAGMSEKTARRYRAFQGVPRASTYAATKAYVQSLAEGLHFELKPHGVDVIACAPGPVRSGFEARAKMTMALALTPDVVVRDTLAAIGRGTTVRPGWLSVLLEGSLALLPCWGRVRGMTLVMRGMASVERPESGGDKPA